MKPRLLSNTVLTLFIAAIATGCSGYQAYEMGTEVGEQGRAHGQLSESLFQSDQAIMDNATIDSILSSTVALPDKSRMIVLNYGRQHYRHWYSEEVGRLDQAATEDFMGNVRASDRIATAYILPAMLAPQQQTIPHFRKAAARCQADLVFLYRAVSLTYQKERAFARDKAKAYCVVEAVLIDTRTGIVPFASAVTKTYTAEKAKDDFSLAETIRKAELKATGEALDQIAGELIDFLAAVPTQTAAKTSG